MGNLLNRIYGIERLLPKSGVLGEVPATRDAYRELLRIALPSVLEMVLMSLIGSMDTIMVGTIGPSAIAAVGLVGQPRMLMLCILFAMNIGVTAVVARRKGEGRQDEANRTLRNAIVLILAVSIVMMTLGLLFSRQLMLMAGAKADTIADAETYFRILMYFLPVNALSMGICAAQHHQQRGERHFQLFFDQRHWFFPAPRGQGRCDCHGDWFQRGYAVCAVHGFQ